MINYYPVGNMRKQKLFALAALMLSGLNWHCEHYALDPETFHRYQIAYLSGMSIWVVNDDASLPNAVAGGEGTYITRAVWSPDGTRFAFAWEREGDMEIYVTDADGGNLTQRTHHKGYDSNNPCWSPDGSQIVFDSNETGNREIYVMSSTGSSARRLTFDAHDDVLPQWSPDGQNILFVRYFIPGSDIFIIKPDGSGLKQLTHANGFITRDARWSFDGSKIAFTSYQSGVLHIYVMNSDGSQERQITTNAPIIVSNLEWSPRTLQLLFASLSASSDQIYYDEVYLVNADGTGLKKNAASQGTLFWNDVVAQWQEHCLLLPCKCG